MSLTFTFAATVAAADGGAPPAPPNDVAALEQALSVGVLSIGDARMSAQLSGTSVVSLGDARGEGAGRPIYVPAGASAPDLLTVGGYPTVRVNSGVSGQASSQRGLRSSEAFVNLAQPFTMFFVGTTETDGAWLELATDDGAMLAGFYPHQYPKDTPTFGSYGGIVLVRGGNPAVVDGAGRPVGLQATTRRGLYCLTSDGAGTLTLRCPSLAPTTVNVGAMTGMARLYVGRPRATDDPYLFGQNDLCAWGVLSGVLTANDLKVLTAWARTRHAIYQGGTSPYIIGCGDSRTIGIDRRARDQYLNTLMETLAAEGHPAEELNLGRGGKGLQQTIDGITAGDLDVLDPTRPTIAIIWEGRNDWMGVSENVMRDAPWARDKYVELSTLLKSKGVDYIIWTTETPTSIVPNPFGSDNSTYATAFGAFPGLLAAVQPANANALVHFEANPHYDATPADAGDFTRFYDGVHLTPLGAGELAGMVHGAVVTALAAVA